MRTHSYRRSALALAALAIGATACDGGDVEDVGEEIGQEVGEGVEEMGEEISEGGEELQEESTDGE